MLLLVLWEELDSPLELDVLAEGAVLSLLEVLCEVLSEADVDPEEAPDEAAEELQNCWRCRWKSWTCCRKSWQSQRSRR